MPRISCNRDKYSLATREKKEKKKKKASVTHYSDISLCILSIRIPRKVCNFFSARLSVICIDHAALNVNDAFEDAVKKETNGRHARNSRKMLRAYVSTFFHSGESSLRKRKGEKKSLLMYTRFTLSVLCSVERYH